MVDDLHDSEQPVIQAVAMYMAEIKRRKNLADGDFFGSVSLVVKFEHGRAKSAEISGVDKILFAKDQKKT